MQESVEDLPSYCLLPAPVSIMRDFEPKRLKRAGLPLLLGDDQKTIMVPIQIRFSPTGVPIHVPLLKPGTYGSHFEKMVFRLNKWNLTQKVTDEMKVRIAEIEEERIANLPVTSFDHWFVPITAEELERAEFNLANGEHDVLVRMLDGRNIRFGYDRDALHPATYDKYGNEIRIVVANSTEHLNELNYIFKERGLAIVKSYNGFTLSFPAGDQRKADNRATMTFQELDEIFQLFKHWLHD